MIARNVAPNQPEVQPPPPAQLSKRSFAVEVRESGDGANSPPLAASRGCVGVQRCGVGSWPALGGRQPVASPADEVAAVAASTADERRGAPAATAARRPRSYDGRGCGCGDQAVARGEGEPHGERGAPRLLPLWPRRRRLYPPWPTGGHGRGPR